MTGSVKPDVERVVIAILAEQAVMNAEKNLQFCLWLWKGPAEAVATAPTPLNLLSRLLGLMEQISHDMRVDHAVRREAYQQIRGALVADNCKTFRAAVAQMDQGIAGTIKRRIEQSPGLSPSSREKLMGIIREEFYALFVRARVEPWLDETVIYSSEAAVGRQEAELKHLTEIVVPENSKRVGAAACSISIYRSWPSSSTRAAGRAAWRRARASTPTA